MSEKQKITHPRILDHMVVCASFGSELGMDFSKIVGFPSALPKNLGHRFGCGREKVAKIFG